MGVCENERVHYFGVLIIRILLYMGTILGSPIFGNSHMGLIPIYLFPENHQGGCLFGQDEHPWWPLPS